PAAALVRRRAVERSEGDHSGAQKTAAAVAWEVQREHRRVDGGRIRGRRCGCVIEADARGSRCHTAVPCDPRGAPSAGSRVWDRERNTKPRRSPPPLDQRIGRRLRLLKQLVDDEWSGRMASAAVVILVNLQLEEEVPVAGQVITGANIVHLLPDRDS